MSPAPLKFLKSTKYMKGINENKINPREREDALLNFVNRQAQEAILDPTLPNSYKDEVLEAAIDTIRKVAERKAIYYAKYGEYRKERMGHVIYEAKKEEDNEQEIVPAVIADLNENLRTPTSPDSSVFTVQWIAESVGINKRVLYEWVESDKEFNMSLERLKEVQRNDPFRTETEEDVFVNSMMVALLLMETKDRHYKNNL